MPSRTIGRAALVCLALAVSIGGCGGGSHRAPTATVVRSIYTALPSEGPYAATASAVYDGEELALTQAGGVVNGIKLVLHRLDDGSSVPAATATAVQASARTAAADRSTMAYLGDLAPGSSSASIPLLSQAGILQVSPGDTATGLVGATFARVVPPDSDEAIAELAEMGKLGLTRAFLLRDRSTYGADIATAAISDAPGYGVTIVDPGGRYLGSDIRTLVKAIKKSKADALLYAGSPTASATTFWNALSTGEPGIRKFASAALSSGPSWALTSAAARYGTYLSAPGLSRSVLPRAGSQFETDFTAAYGNRVPWTSGIFGYVAMSGVLDTIYRLGSTASSRAKLADAFLHTKNLPSALGTYSIAGGQTSFDHYFFTTYARDGKTVIPVGE